ncbi:hypothetical protein QBC46DRAFT_412581 [Diplogelasinospora grovesii]|uniref:Uncharacterized protein n=1 Tax=Diplogelasinospora grovesii TaxID=303347 RepID=A0AAN6S0E7_9PEZI|nr:hypothetical protein QBC46DRAFT_412581 [Diplogelasinospora grovesii]
MPDDARCVFSLNAEITAKRHLRLRLPEQQAEVWDEGRIQEKVNNIRDHYPFESRRVAAIDTWEDLFEYFDAHDLWHLLLRPPGRHSAGSGGNGRGGETTPAPNTAGRHRERESMCVCVCVPVCVPVRQET